MLLEILSTYWPMLPSASSPSDEVMRNLIELAECWCGFQQPEIYTAGANLLQWIIVSHPHLATAKAYASSCLSKTADWVSLFINWRHSRGLKGSSYLSIIGYLSAIDGAFVWCNKALSSSKTEFPLLVSESPQDQAPLERLECFLDPSLPKLCLDLSRECLAIMGVPYRYTDYDAVNISHLIAGCRFFSCLFLTL